MKKKNESIIKLVFDKYDIQVEKVSDLPKKTYKVIFDDVILMVIDDGCCGSPKSEDIKLEHINYLLERVIDKITLENQVKYSEYIFELPTSFLRKYAELNIHQCNFFGEIELKSQQTNKDKVDNVINKIEKWLKEQQGVFEYKTEEDKVHGFWLVFLGTTKFKTEKYFYIKDREVFDDVVNELKTKSYYFKVKSLEKKIFVEVEYVLNERFE